ncbi:DUF6090 family protein [Algoriphagus halophilus]|uniref:Uncharacterized protein n=1 Tax=Algoriphagus halophilus TaxID=226505 RepID=A0A1N6G1C7_9BACT|nr:DUF6090 family protein [Algoriphagus halophilus]SIO01277.1 hypothetical protein SAMN05444394_2890 [Algoriphagus halophilus]
MISFFRKIRQKLLAQNRVTRYLAYAVGEILLVVIGILIALQVNNWNENRKDAEKEIQLLTNLQVEFKDNLKDLDSISIEVEEVIYSLEKLFDSFSREPSPNLRDSVDRWIASGLQSPNWKPSQYILNSLTSSGSITNLKNERLKLLLYQWSRQQNEMLEVQLRSEETGEEIISYVKEFGSLRNIDTTHSDFKYESSTLGKSNSGLLSDVRFENLIDDKLYMYKLTKKWLETAKKTLEQLIEETNS